MMNKLKVGKHDALIFDVAAALDDNSFDRYLHDKSIPALDCYCSSFMKVATRR